MFASRASVWERRKRWREGEGCGGESGERGERLGGFLFRLQQSSDDDT